MPRPFNALDHVLIRAGAAEPLIDLLHGRFGLPMVWPLRREPFATYGWIGVGNTSLEVWAAADNGDLPATCALPHPYQLALEPRDLAIDSAELAAVGITCKAPRTWRSPDRDGVPKANFTNAMILDVSGEACGAFFCDWDADAPIVPWPRGLTRDELRSHKRGLLEACGGGVLGVIGLRRITLRAPTPDDTAAVWRRLCDASVGPCMLTDDIELRIEGGGTQTMIESLVFAVRDVASARATLAAMALLDDGDRSDEVWLRRDAVGLRLGFAAQR